MQREPNTQYVLSLSYGKDSLACLEAIRVLGLPLDRIVHAEVWATDTIPADLPPMVEFKQKADAIILERYGIIVEHICATERERDGSRSSLSSTRFGSTSPEDATKSMDFLSPEGLGATPNSKCGRCNLSKRTFESLFYQIPEGRTGVFAGSITGFPMVKMPYCNSRLKTRVLNSFSTAPANRGLR